MRYLTQCDAVRASSWLSELSDYLHCPNMTFITIQPVHSFLCIFARQSFVFSYPLLRCTLSIFEPCLTQWANPTRLSARHKSRLCDRAFKAILAPNPIQPFLESHFYSEHGVRIIRWSPIPILPSEPFRQSSHPAAGDHHARDTAKHSLIGHSLLPAHIAVHNAQIGTHYRHDGIHVSEFSLLVENEHQQS